MHMLMMIVPVLVVLYGVDLARFATRAGANSAEGDREFFDKTQQTAGSTPAFKADAAVHRLEPAVFRAAALLGGILTVSDVVVETGLPVDSARTLLERMTDGEHVCMEVSENGRVEFHFPEIRNRLSEQGYPKA